MPSGPPYNNLQLEWGRSKAFSQAPAGPKAGHDSPPPKGGNLLGQGEES